MKKRSKLADIYNKIVETLKTGSYNILQISEKTGINWETVKNALINLESLNLVSKQTKNNKTYYFMDESKLIEFNKNTLLGLPISKKQKQTTLSLAKRIAEIWNKKTSKPLRKTFLHKMLIKLVKEEQIKNVPYGLYLFGQCSVLQFETQELTSMQSIKKYDEQINEIVEKYSKILNTNELLEQHYIEEGNDLYLTRLKISNILINNFNEDALKSLKANLKNFLLSFKKTEDNEDLLEYINGFYSIVIKLTKELPIEELEEMRPQINDSFRHIWEIMGTYKLYESLSKFYDKQILKKHYSLWIENLKHISEIYLSELKDNIPIKETKEDSLSRFKGIQASQFQ
jgi:predicted transcriptional regulator